MGLTQEKEVRYVERLPVLVFDRVVVQHVDAHENCEQPVREQQKLNEPNDDADGDRELQGVGRRVAVDARRYAEADKAEEAREKSATHQLRVVLLGVGHRVAAGSRGERLVLLVLGSRRGRGGEGLHPWEGGGEAEREEEDGTEEEWGEYTSTSDARQEPERENVSLGECWSCGLRTVSMSSFVCWPPSQPSADEGPRFGADLA